MTERATELIERLGTVQRAARRRHATAADLSLAQLDALVYLAGCNRFSDTPAAVALFLDATRGTTSQSLLALERKGLVTRSADARDRRVQHLRPTAAGRRIAAAASADDLSAGLRGLSAPELTALERGLERVLRSTQRARGGRSFGECGTCAHLRGAERGDMSCGLTGEPLSPDETHLRCAEHAPV